MSECDAECAEGLIRVVIERALSCLQIKFDNREDWTGCTRVAPLDRLVLSPRGTVFRSDTRHAGLVSRPNQRRQHVRDRKRPEGFWIDLLPG
eukprot:5524134-Pyramimonas_sp.AAC.1